MSTNWIKEKKGKENDYGVTSIEESSRLHQSKISSNSSNSNSKIQQCDSNDNWVVPKVKTLSQQKSSRFRMIVCGDSGVGKSTLVQTLSGLEILPNNSNNSLFEPIEVFVPETDTCIIDTIGYGALLRADVIFSNVKNYIEQQFEKTNKMFNSNYIKEEENIKYMVYQSTEILTHVDACLYIIMGRLKAIDIEYMRTLQDLVNIIPIIVQSNLTIRQEERIEQRLEIINILKKNDIEICLFGYNNYEEMLNDCKEPLKYPLCPPFILDYSNTSKKRTFHGLLPLKQLLYQHQYKFLKYNTTEKFMNWRNHHSTTFQSTSTTSSSSQEHIKSNTIKISQYISKRRHSMEREMLIQEKKLLNELESSNKQRRTEIILKELNLLVNHQKEDIKTTIQPMTYHYYWFWLSIVLAIFICYQNGSSLITKCMQSI